MLILKIAETLTAEEEALGVRRIAPVWGAKLSAGEYFNLISPSQVLGLDLLAPSELGCTLSHLKAYEIVAAEGISAMIVEDDILLDKESLEKVRSFAREPLHFVHFARYEQFQFRGKQVEEYLWEVDFRKDFWGTAAYWISVQAAQRLIQFHRPATRKADDWATFFATGQIKPYFSPVFCHPLGTSSIEVERRRHRPMNARALLVRRLRQYIARQGLFFPRLARQIPDSTPEGGRE